MSLLDWDAELTAVRAEADRLVAAQREGKAAPRRDLIGRKVAAVQAQLRLERAFERLKRLAQKDLLLLPRDKAVLHWGRIYRERAEAHLELLGKVLTKNLWLKLVTLRSGQALDGDELVGLSVRQASLGKTERYLKTSLAAVKARQQQLVASYHALAVEKANREAAACMSARLGLTFADAAANPATNALASYFMRLTAGARGDAAARRFFDLSRRYEGKAQLLMGLCRDAALKRAPGQEPTPKALAKMQTAMRQLDELEGGVRGAYQEVALDRAPKARPTVRRVANPPRTG